MQCVVQPAPPEKREHFIVVIGAARNQLRPDFRVRVHRAAAVGKLLLDLLAEVALESLQNFVDIIARVMYLVLALFVCDDWLRYIIRQVQRE